MLVQGEENYSKTNLNRTSCQYKLTSVTAGIHPPGRQIKKGHFSKSSVDEALMLWLLAPSPALAHTHASEHLKLWEVMDCHHQQPSGQAQECHRLQTVSCSAPQSGNEQYKLPGARGYASH